MKYLALLLVSAAIVRAYKKGGDHKIDLAVGEENADIDHFEGNFDNVFYDYYKPEHGNFVTSVYEGNTPIWDPLASEDICKYAVVANKNRQPALLYLIIGSAQRDYEEFFRKEGSLWRRIDSTEYKIHISRLKEQTPFRPVTIFLSSRDHSPFYWVYNYTGPVPYRFYSPKYGFMAWRVFYKRAIWSAHSEKERCVGVWAHEREGVKFSPVKLLLTRPNGTSEVVDYIYSDYKWRLYDPAKDQDDFASFAGLHNFLHPEYDLMDLESEILFPPKPYKAPEDPVVVVNNDPSVLYINPSVDNEYVRTYNEYVDDVFYHQYFPKSQDSVKRVIDGVEEVWTSYNSETCKYVLKALDRDTPALLYILLQMGKERRSIYMIKNEDKWVRTDFAGYKRRVNEIKSTIKIVDYRPLDLSASFDNNSYDISFGDSYIQFSPRLGTRISTVSYLSHDLWKVERGERCVAVWAFGEDLYYMLKLLITRGDDSEILTYYRMRGVFMRVDSIELRKTAFGEKKYYYLIEGKEYMIPEGYVRASVDSPPAFYYPEYDFTPKSQELEPYRPMETFRSVYELLGNYKDIEAYKYMRNLPHPLYNDKVCVQADVARLSAGTGTLSSAVYDRTLHVHFVEPPQGMYFSEISEKGVKMYSRGSRGEAAVGAFLYLEDHKYVLADVVLADSRPGSIHLEKVDGVWKYIGGKEFAERLEDMKKRRSAYH